MDIALMTRKAEALEQTANHLERNIDKYNWMVTPSCNCGFLAQVATGLTEDDLRFLKSQEFLDGKLECGDWGTIALESPVCPQTGIPVSTILKSMTSLGFSLDEIASIEHLSDKRLLDLACQSIGIEDDLNPLYEDPQVVIAYFRAWARELRQEITQHQQVQASVSVPAKPKASQPVSVQVHL